jgi:hypothetical protein
LKRVCFDPIFWASTSGVEPIGKCNPAWLSTQRRITGKNNLSKWGIKSKICLVIASYLSPLADQVTD